MRTTILACGVLLLAACKGDAGADGTSCTVTNNGDGTVTISCEDGTSVTVADGQDGQDGTDGTSCTVADNGDGTKTISCDDGTTVTVSDGSDGEDGVDGVDGTNGSDGVNGEPGGNVEITKHHGSDFLRQEEFDNDGKYLVDAEITSATADGSGVVNVYFHVQTRGGNPTPVLDITTVSANIDKLVPAAVDPDLGPIEASNHWVPYIYRVQTVSGDTYPNPAGTSANQAYRESTTSTPAGMLVNLGEGDYQYTFGTNIANVTTPVAVTYERNLTHRVSIMMGGHSGATASPSFDFVPDGSAVTETRNIISTSACMNCHGDEFAGHGGDRVTVDNCVTCHVQGNWDPQGGESVDLEVMIHKIHSGGELPRIAGADGIVWDDPATTGVDESADNGEYAIWGNSNSKHEWWQMEFPARLENCRACHQGTGQDVDNWKQKASRAACGACHENIDFNETDHDSPSYHPGGSQSNDGTCRVCHGVGRLYEIDVAHNWTDGLNDDPRTIAEFIPTLTMSPPANGSYYDGNEAPLVTVQLRENGALIDHRIFSGSAQGCTPTGSPPTCPADTDGKFAATSMFVSGPRARRMPVLTTAARAQVFSSNTGPWDISAVGANLVLKLDDGENLLTEAAGGTTVSGTVTVAVTAATAANLTAATPAELATWLNGNAGFAARAIAYVEGGKLGLRSRNLGQVHAIQLQTSIVDTQVFAGDILPHTPTGSTPSNKLGQQSTPSANDPKAAWLADGSAITYQLDPVTDLAPGTYVVDIEFGRLGRISATNYKLPTVGRVTFQVKQATEELPVARNCNSCHQSPDNRGMVFDPSRHNKIFNDTAVDQCGSCHDYQPQLVPGMTGYVAGNWSGAVPIAKRVHAVHNGINLTYPVATVGHSDEIPGRDWAIEFPQNIRNCEACHPDGTTSGTWATEAARLPCSGCHDSDEATAHIRIMTYDPTPADPWSGDEQQSCKACH